MCVCVSIQLIFEFQLQIEEFYDVFLISADGILSLLLVAIVF